MQRHRCLQGRLTNDVHTVWIDNSTRQQVEVVFLITDDYCMSCIVSALNNIQSIQRETRKVFRIGTVRYNWPMAAHALQAFSIAHCTDSEDLPETLTAILQCFTSSVRNTNCALTCSKVTVFHPKFEQ